MDEVELICVLRGIRHHTMFARWWATEILRENPFVDISLGSPEAEGHIRRAINARRIMNGDIIGLEKDVHLPWMIWRPLRPSPNTLLSLAKICPSMKEQIGIACIFENYQREYDMIKPFPTDDLYGAAKHSTNKYYLLDLKERAEKEGFKIHSGGMTTDSMFPTQPDAEPTKDTLKSRLEELAVQRPLEEYYFYDDYQVIVNHTERHVWASKELLHKVEILGSGEWWGDALDLEMEPTPEEESIFGP